MPCLTASLGLSSLSFEEPAVKSLLRVEEVTDEEDEDGRCKLPLSTWVPSHLWKILVLRE